MTWEMLKTNFRLVFLVITELSVYFPDILQLVLQLVKAVNQIHQY